MTQLRHFYSLILNERLFSTFNPAFLTQDYWSSRILNLSHSDTSTLWVVRNRVWWFLFGKLECLSLKLEEKMDLVCQNILRASYVAFRNSLKAIFKGNVAHTNYYSTRYFQTLYEEKMIKKVGCFFIKIFTKKRALS